MGVTFQVGGETVALEPSEVVQKLKGKQPGPIRTHAVEVGGKLYPVKEAFSTVTGLDVMDFNTTQARSAFKRLGFRVVRVVASHA